MNTTYVLANAGAAYEGVERWKVSNLMELAAASFEKAPVRRETDPLLDPEHSDPCAALHHHANEVLMELRTYVGPQQAEMKLCIQFWSLVLRTRDLAAIEQRLIAALGQLTVVVPDARRILFPDP